MKFVCNNCGFTADIPEQMSACPMCGSSNVSSSVAEASNFTAETSENNDENVKSQNFKAAAGPTQRVTLTEMKIEEKSETPVETPVKKSRGKKAAVIVVILLVIAAAVAAGLLFLFQ